MISKKKYVLDINGLFKGVYLERVKKNEWKCYLLFNII